MWHGHDCITTQKIKSEKWRSKQAQLLERTRQRTEYLESKGYTVTEKWECDYLENDMSDVNLSGVTDRYLPPFSRRHKGRYFTRETLMTAVEQEEFFGMVECDIEVSYINYNLSLNHKVTTRSNGCCVHLLKISHYVSLCFNFVLIIIF